MDEFEQIPILRQDVLQVRNIISEGEMTLGLQEDPIVRAMQAVVGIADYTDAKDLTFEKMIEIIGVQYGILRRAFLKSKQN